MISQDGPNGWPDPHPELDSAVYCRGLRSLQLSLKMQEPAMSGSVECSEAEVYSATLRLVIC